MTIQETEAYKGLFSSDDLSYSKKIHKKLISKLYHFLGDNQADNQFEIGEETFQTEIHRFLTNKLANTEYIAKREENVFDARRLDHCVYHETLNMRLVFYELKTYFRRTEKYVNKTSVYIDILKLAIKKYNSPNSKAYFIIAGKTGVLKKAFRGLTPLKLPNKFVNPNNRQADILSIEFIQDSIGISNPVRQNYLREINKPIKISPSVWRNYMGVSVITWKINKI